MIHKICLGDKIHHCIQAKVRYHEIQVINSNLFSEDKTFDVSDHVTVFQHSVFTISQ